MGIQIEFNPDLALRKYNSPNRSIEECLPENIEKEKVYKFLKKGQRNYWLEGEIALLETKGEQQLSRPLASIKILESTHFIKNNEIYTGGKYKVIDVFDARDNKIHFEWLTRRN